MTEALGWLSSFILVLTIAKQVHKQWREGTSEGVSKWLFLGQLAASSGFTAYSWLVHNWVFVVTNGLMLLNGLAGLAIVLRHRRRGRSLARPPAAATAGASSRRPAPSGGLSAPAAAPRRASTPPAAGRGRAGPPPPRTA